MQPDPDILKSTLCKPAPNIRQVRPNTVHESSSEQWGRDSELSPDEEDDLDHRAVGATAFLSPRLQALNLKFRRYYSKEEVDAGLKDGSLVKGVLHINYRNPDEASVYDSTTHECFVIRRPVHRNRALNGDIVAVRIMGKDYDPVADTYDATVTEEDVTPEDVHRDVSERVSGYHNRTGKYIGGRSAKMGPLDLRWKLQNSFARRCSQVEVRSNIVRTFDTRSYNQQPYNESSWKPNMDRRFSVQHVGSWNAENRAPSGSQREGIRIRGQVMPSYDEREEKAKRLKFSTSEMNRMPLRTADQNVLQRNDARRSISDISPKLRRDDTVSQASPPSLSYSAALKSPPFRAQTAEPTQAAVPTVDVPAASAPAASGAPAPTATTTPKQDAVSTTPSPAASGVPLPIGTSNPALRSVVMTTSVAANDKDRKQPGDEISKSALRSIVVTASVATGDRDRKRSRDELSRRSSTSTYVTANLQRGSSLNKVSIESSTSTIRGVDDSRKRSRDQISARPSVVKDDGPAAKRSKEEMSRSSSNNLSPDLYKKMQVPWKFDSTEIRYGEVVAISTQVHTRLAGGWFVKGLTGSGKLFRTADRRLPSIILITDDKLPQSDQPGQNEDIFSNLYLCKITHWDTVDTYPHGTIVACLGKLGSEAAELRRMLLENDIDDTPFTQESLSCLPTEPFTKEELRMRSDYSRLCTFTIDSSYTKVMDDALSCELVEKSTDHSSAETYEVGVHIADVTHFLKKGTPLDDEARTRGTDVHIDTQVIHMLPKELSRLCSLDAGVRRLAFSLLWHINSETGAAKLMKIARSHICSCAKLSYDAVQAILNNPHDLSPLPQIHGGFSSHDVAKRLNTLRKLAAKIREQRYLRGAIPLYDSSRIPNRDPLKEANRLVEELMLLANSTVAAVLCRRPGKVLLCRQNPPRAAVLAKIKRQCDYIKLPIDISNPQNLQMSYEKYVDGEDKRPRNQQQVLSHYLSALSKKSYYFTITSPIPSIGDKYYGHFILGLNKYTHFTSPIRRYADVIVHRLLATSCNLRKPTDLKEDDIGLWAEYLNTKTVNARLIKSLKADLDALTAIKKQAFIEEKGVVTAVQEHSFDVQIFAYGDRRVLCKDLGLVSYEYYSAAQEKGINCLLLRWPDINERSRCNDSGLSIPQAIRVFDTVTCILTCKSEERIWRVTIKPPAPREGFSRSPRSQSSFVQPEQSQSSTKINSWPNKSNPWSTRNKQFPQPTRTRSSLGSW